MADLMAEFPTIETGRLDPQDARREYPPKRATPSLPSTQEDPPMTAADEYERVRIDAAVHALLMSDAMTGNDEGTPTSYCVDAENVEYLVRTVLEAAGSAQALAADPGVRAAVEREARADEWDLWHDATCPWMADDGCAGDHKNPYDRQEPTDG